MMYRVTIVENAVVPRTKQNVRHVYAVEAPNESAAALAVVKELGLTPDQVQTAEVEAPRSIRLFSNVPADQRRSGDEPGTGAAAMTAMIDRLKRK